TDSQRTFFYLDANTTFNVGRWVTHETWCESLPGGGYPLALFIDIGLNVPLGPCLSVIAQSPVLYGAPFMPGYNKVFLVNTPIVLVPTHALLQPFNAFYYVGYQIPASLLGYSLIAQWVRIDPNGHAYASDMNGYSVSM